MGQKVEKNTVIHNIMIIISLYWGTQDTQAVIILIRLISLQHIHAEVNGSANIILMK